MITQIEENFSAIFPIIWFAFIMIVFLWTTYRVWFKTAEYQDSMIKAYERLPKWVPFRDLNISWYSSSTSMWFAKLLMLVITLLLSAGILFAILGFLFMR